MTFTGNSRQSRLQMAVTAPPPGEGVDTATPQLQVGASGALPAPGPNALTVGFGVLTQSKTHVGFAPTQTCLVLALPRTSYKGDNNAFCILVCKRGSKPARPVRIKASNYGVLSTACLGTRE